MKKFFQSFRAAGRGILFCLNHERNMRIHTVVTVYVLLFLRFFNLSPGETAILFLAFGLVMGAEMLNTAIEGLTDMKSPEFSKTARIVKDIAAGAVLVCAVFSVCVAACLFANLQGLTAIWRFFYPYPWRILALTAFTALCVCFIIFGFPTGRKHRK